MRSRGSLLPELGMFHNVGYTIAAAIYYLTGKQSSQGDTSWRVVFISILEANDIPEGP